MTPQGGGGAVEVAGHHVEHRALLARQVRCGPVVAEVADEGTEGSLGLRQTLGQRRGGAVRLPPPQVSVGLGDGPAEVAHHGAGDAEVLDHAPQVREDGLGTRGGQLPCTQHPMASAGVRHEQTASPVASTWRE